MEMAENSGGDADSHEEDQYSRDTKDHLLVLAQENFDKSNELLKAVKGDGEDDIDDATELCLLAVSEFLSSAILIILSMGGEMSIGYEDRFGIAFVNGLAEMTCIYSFTELKADFNPAVTLTFLITGDCDLIHAFVKIVAQIVGGLVGCLLLINLFEEENDMTHHFAALKISDTCSYSSAWGTEIVLTYIVIFSIFQTAESNGEHGEALAATLSSPLAVGFTVISAVGVAFPLTGASLNPTRALSTAAIGSIRYGGLFKDMEVFVLGPMIAGALVGLQERFFMEHLRSLYAKVDGLSNSSFSLTKVQSLSRSKVLKQKAENENFERLATLKTLDAATLRDTSIDAGGDSSERV